MADFTIALQGWTWNLIAGGIVDPAQVNVQIEVTTESTRDFYFKEMPDLPAVCDQGQECRDKVITDTDVIETIEWHDAWTNIVGLFENELLLSKDLCKKAWEEMKECDADCMCDDILTEYNEILMLQEQLEKDIDLLEKQVLALEQKQKEIIETCPDYEVRSVELVGEWETETVTYEQAEAEQDMVWDNENQVWVPITEEVNTDDYTYAQEEFVGESNTYGAEATVTTF